MPKIVQSEYAIVKMCFDDVFADENVPLTVSDVRMEVVPIPWSCDWECTPYCQT